MDADQNAICTFLKTWPGQFVSRREICRRAGGKWRFREDENWMLLTWGDMSHLAPGAASEGDDP